MKYLSSPSLLLFLLVTTLSAVHGFDVDNLHYRQVNIRPSGASTSSTQQPSPASTPTDATTASSTSTAESLTSSATSSAIPLLTSATPDVATNSAAATPSSSSPENSATSTPTSQTALTPSRTTNKPQTTAKPNSSIPTLSPVSSRLQEVITTVVSVSGSATYTNIITTSALQAVDPTTTPPVGPGDKGSDGQGLEPAQKRLIIGVVVGVGGMILVGGLVIVAWRIWGKRKEPADDDHELIDSLPGTANQEKSSSLTSNSPFRSTLDQYHKPAGPVNTASNF